MDTSDRHAVPAGERPPLAEGDAIMRSHSGSEMVHVHVLNARPRACAHGARLRTLAQTVMQDIPSSRASITRWRKPACACTGVVWPKISTAMSPSSNAATTAGAGWRSTFAARPRPVRIVRRARRTRRGRRCTRCRGRCPGPAGRAGRCRRGSAETAPGRGAAGPASRARWHVSCGAARSQGGLRSACGARRSG